MQLAAIIVSLVLIVVGVALFARALLQFSTFMRLSTFSALTVTISTPSVPGR